MDGSSRSCSHLFVDRLFVEQAWGGYRWRSEWATIQAASISLSADGQTVAIGAPIQRRQWRVAQVMFASIRGRALRGASSGRISMVKQRMTIQARSVSLSADGQTVAIGAYFERRQWE